eukprot:GAHX01002215.1.p1 GENE.GAHX01002215.1~~GAHX01002215.1.p1  ORF type:complete len:217 (-),score=56.44 GAHX01002215.1:27-677(-)
MTIATIEDIQFPTELIISPSTTNITSKVTLEVIEPGIKEEISIKVAFIASSSENIDLYSDKGSKNEADQILTHIATGPFNEGMYEISIDFDAPNLEPLLSTNNEDVLSIYDITALVYRFSYKGEEFARRAYLLAHSFNKEDFDDIKNALDKFKRKEEIEEKDESKNEEMDVNESTDLNKLWRFISVDNAIVRDYVIDWDKVEFNKENIEEEEEEAN